MKWVQQRATKTVGGQETMNINWNEIPDRIQKTLFHSKDGRSLEQVF